MRKLVPLDNPQSDSPLQSGDGGGTSDDMEARVTSLERRFDRFEAKLDTLIRDVSEVRGRVSAMPSTWQLVGIVLAVLGAAFVIIRLGLPG